MRRIKGNAAAVTVVAVSLLGAAALGRGLLRLVPRAAGGSGVAVQTLGDLHQQVYHVAFSPDGRTLATAGGFFHLDSELVLWDLPTGRPRLALAGHVGAVRAVSFSADGAILASSGIDRTVRLWDPHTGQELANLGLFPTPVFSVALAPDGQTLAALCFDHVEIWDVPSRKQRCNLDGFGYLAFAPDGRTVAIGCRDTITLWDAASGTPRTSWTTEAHGIQRIAYSQDGRYLAVVGDYTPIEVWDAEQQTLFQTLTSTVDHVAALAFSADGRLLASAGADQTIRLWDLATGLPSGVLTGHHDKVSALAFSPDGSRLASGSHDKTVRLWNLPKEI